MAPKRKAASTASTVDGKETKKVKSTLTMGDIIPEATLENEEVHAFNLEDLTRDSGVVIFLYPKANTGGCSKQACGFKEQYNNLKKAGYEVYGMSYDKPKSQANWKAKYHLPYHLLTDTSGEVIRAFGAGKGSKGILRSHVIVEKGGKIIDIRNGISPGDSFIEAVDFVTQK